MIIRVCGEGRFDIDISQTELGLYSLDFAGLSASNGQTRRLLHDVLGVLDTMGVRGRGVSALVECDSVPDGCRLHVTLARRWFRFDSAADVQAAVKAGLGDILTGSLVEDGQGFVLAADVPEERVGLLLEFCRRGESVSG